MLTPSEKFRKLVLLKAYNIRRHENAATFSEQFYKISFVDNKKHYLKWKALVKYLELNYSAFCIDNLSVLSRSESNLSKEIVEVEDFLYFLRYGQLRGKASSMPKEQNELDSTDVSYAPIDSNTTYSEGGNHVDGSLPEIVDEHVTVIIDQSLGTNVEVYKCGNEDVVINNNEPKLALIRRINIETTDGKSVANVWRKSETLKQERIVSYITTDGHGTQQVLCEKEVTETEVLHMEDRDTGEFAHRETTVMHHKETFNNETVVENEGKEEYIHLKSLDNEVEYMESTLPKKETHDVDGQMNTGDSAELREPFSQNIIPGEDQSVVYPNSDDYANMQSHGNDIILTNDSNFDMIANDDPNYNVQSSFENDNSNVEKSSFHDLKKTLFENL